ncbi:MAG: extracellular solute-binding protein [Candidatus Pacearchaeota archaeon]|nr:extracellular solute-binding protein [Candidatus Pacearchaeota archaeon]
MELITALSISNYFVQFILVLILIGILISEFVKRKSQKEGILLYLLVFVFIIGVNIFDTILTFNPEYLWFILFTGTFTILWMITFIINSIMVWKYVDDFLFFLVLIFSMITLLLRVILSTTIASNYEFFVIISYFSAIVSGYFFIIKFLINSSKKKINPKKLKIKKAFLILSIIIILLILSFASLKLSTQPDNKLSPELRIYNWEDYFADGSVIENFEKEFEINVTVDTFEDEYDMFYELSENPSEFNYDIVIVSDDLLEDMINNKFLNPIRKRNIPNIKYLDNKCLSKEYKEYVVPYFWGTTGIAFNKKYLPENTNSWNTLWNKNYEGKISVLDNPSEVIGMTAKYIGLPLVPQTEAQLKEIEKFLLLQKPLLSGYDSEETITKKLITEEIWVAQIYGSDARTANKLNDNLKYILPNEGGVQWVDNFVILKNAKNKNTAEAFINYINTPKINKILIEYQEGYSCNTEAMKLIDENLLPSLSENDLKFFEYFSDYKRSELMQELKHTLWEKLTQ